MDFRNVQPYAENKYLTEYVGDKDNWKLDTMRCTYNKDEKFFLLLPYFEDSI